MIKRKVFEKEDLRVLSGEQEFKILEKIINAYNDLDEDLEVFGCEVEDILIQHINFHYE